MMRVMAPAKIVLVCVIVGVTVVSLGSDGQNITKETAVIGRIAVEVHGADSMSCCMLDCVLDFVLYVCVWWGLLLD